MLATACFLLALWQMSCHVLHSFTTSLALCRVWQHATHGIMCPERVCMYRAIARGAVAALAFCHERGIAHGALGAACFLLSTFDDRRASELVVKLDNFGFARMQRRPVRVSSLEGARVLLPQGLGCGSTHTLRPP